MHHRIAFALGRLRQDLDARLDEAAVHDACRGVGHTWRDCLLTPVAILRWFVVQVLHGNTALTHVSLLAGRSFTDAAFCLARARLPLAAYRAVLRGQVEALAPDNRTQGTWRGHRTFLVDGSSFSMPDTPELRAHFGTSGRAKPGCSFPVARILALFHAGTGMLLEVVAAPLRSHEMAGAGSVHAHLGPGDVLVGDRGFCSFLHLAILAARGAHAAIRMHHRQIVDFTPHRPHVARDTKEGAKGRPRSRWLRRLGERDQVVEWSKPNKRPPWLAEEQFAALPATLTLRELRYDIGRPGYRTRSVTLVTTLLDAGAYPPESLAELYGMRWRVELNLRHLKQTMRLDVLRCKTVDGVLKELAVYAMVYNLVRVVMLEAARRQERDVERISFVDALRWLADPEGDEELPGLVVNPDRPGRVEPRVVKWRPKKYMWMTRTRAEWRKRLMAQPVAG
ncbi:MAG: transposase family protein [Planctomycetota bacterium]|nr:transposase family protein [Planctomycetota bacterium]